MHKAPGRERRNGWRLRIRRRSGTPAGLRSGGDRNRIGLPVGGRGSKSREGWRLSTATPVTKTHIQNLKIF
nr:MAG TPA: hypothetical protein [Bacteriophage sp.]